VVTATLHSITRLGLIVIVLILLSGKPIQLPLGVTPVLSTILYAYSSPYGRKTESSIEEVEAGTQLMSRGSKLEQSAREEREVGCLT